MMSDDNRDLAEQKSDLGKTFRSWERERLQLYASELTKAVASERRKNQELSKRLEEKSTLGSFSLAVSSAKNLDEVLHEIYKQVTRVIDTPAFFIAIYDEDANELDFSLVYDRGQMVEPFRLKVSDGLGPAVQVLRSRQPLLIRDWEAAPEAKAAEPILPGTSPGSWLGVPVISGKQTVGVIAVQSDKPGAFGDWDGQMLSTIADQAAFAIRYARYYETSTRRARELATMAEVSHTLSSTLNLDEVLTLIMERVNDLLGVSAGSIMLIEAATGDLVFQTTLGEKADQVKPLRLKMGEGIAGHVALTGEPLMIADVQEDQRHSKTVDASTNFQTRSMLCVPLMVRGKVIGVLEVMNKVKGDFTTDDLRLLTSIAAYAAIAIENARLYRNVLAERDRVIIAQEEVRRQLARDLHDGPTQLVAAMLMNLEFVRKALIQDPSRINHELDKLMELGQKATHQMRTLLFELRPLVLETHGLVPALKIFLERRQKDEETDLHLELQCDQFPRLEPKEESAVFAVVQEAVNNALKHAKANDIWVRLKRTGGGFLITVEDNGKGFDVDAVAADYKQRVSLGMVNMREQIESVGGHLHLESKVGQGTKVAIWVPRPTEPERK